MKMNKKISTVSVASTVAGAFIGAGFVSGQELWQFFGVFGKMGIITLLLSQVLLGVLCILFTHFCKDTGRFYLEAAVFKDAPKPINALFCALEMLMCFFLCVIMTSGFMALLESFMSTASARIIGLVFTALVGAALFFGINGLVRLFSLFIPLLVVSTVIISVITLSKNGIVLPEAASETDPNPLMRVPLLACLLSLSYNFFGSVGILAALSENTENRKQLTVSSVLGVSFLFVIAVSIILSIFATSTHSAAIPMLEIAKNINPVFSVIYAVLLSSAMFSCSYSSSVCVILFAEKKALHTSLKKILFIIIYFSIIYAVSLLGFTDLISTVYPIFGYIGFILIIAVVYNSITNRRKRNV